MKQIDLPNGLRIQALNSAEANVLYREIYALQSYEKHGIELTEGGCVFDVGANIGLYSIFLSQRVPGLKLFAFEPIPDLFAVLQRNARSYFPNARLLNVGLSDRPGKASFTYTPSLSMTAGMYADKLNDSVQKEAGAYAWMQAALTDMGRASVLPAALTRRLCRMLSRPILRTPTLVLLAVPMLGSMLFQRLTTKHITCSLTTVSQLIREYELDRIDLMKIDVEGSELDVIHGIEAHDWPRIRQLVIEVHDVDDRVKTMVNLLTDKGYRTTVDQEDWALHKLMNIYTLYATRPTPPESPR